MTYGNYPPGGYEDPPSPGRPGGYEDPPPAGPARGYGNPPGDYEDPPGGYANPPRGYGNPPGGYANPPGGYANPPGGYANPPRGYGNPPGGYSGPPAPSGYGFPGPDRYAPGPGGYAPDQDGYDTPSNYANWLQRVGAYLVDVVPAVVLVAIGAATGSTAIYFLFVLLAIGVFGYNRWFQAGKTSQSWGKKVLRISLIGDETGQPIGAGMAFVRDICHVIDSITCYIGYLFPLWDAKRQTLADKVMRTVVIPAA